MDEANKINLFIRVKRKNLALIEDKLTEIQNTFSVRLQKCLLETSNPRVVFFKLEQEKRREGVDICLSDIQNYVDSLCDGCEGGDDDGDGEDSSYDSDQESEPPPPRHHDVSRTASDTLGAEFAEYVSLPPHGYLAKVEFGLKLGYTERHVQAALQKLGPNPGQNDLLAELIKLGAQTPPRLGSESSTDGVEEEVPELPSLSPLDTDTYRLRHVIIDGSNVAMSHGNKVVFSCRGIKICVDWFKSRGHKEITVFVPLWRKESSRPDSPITDQEILNELEREKILVFTPSRHCNGKRIQCYDDRYILKLAAEVDGIVVSNDNYRDLIPENPEYRKVIEERLLMYSFVNDRFMPPDDPLGRSGPTLDKFLRKEPRRGDPPPPCPYGKKCTYGNKCKFYHPERGPLPHKSVTERLAENAQRHLQARGRDSSPGNQLKGKSLSLPLQSSEGAMKVVKKTPLSRTKSAVTTESAAASLLVQSSSSLENIEGSCFRAPPPSYATPPPSMWGPKPGWDEGENLHRKLQRQLTLNPSCDPRLYHIQRQHQAVTRVMSCEPTAYPTSGHQHVTRIASAPPSHPSTLALHPRPLSSASDPQLNLSAPPPVLPPAWPVPPPAAPHPQTFHPLGPHSLDEARQRLVYHLSSIFPEEQVQAALRYYPNETNPQKICAAILSMFPPKP